MNQVSKPMQLCLGAALLFAVIWFVALRPKDPVAEPIAATPAPVTTPRSDAGGAAAESALGKTVENAKNGAANADAAVKAREQQTGEEADTSKAGTPATSTKQSSPAAEAATAGAATPTTPTSPSGSATKASTAGAAQDRANAAIRSIKRDLAARRAVVVLVWSPSGKEDKVLHTRIKKDIDRRRGRVHTYFINVRDVGRYDGLLSGLAISQTPSTIVIAPSNEAKVLGGLTSTERIDRLTSSALQLKPVATK